jgi:hypothetical protein
MIDNELEWVHEYGTPRMNYHRYDDRPEDPSELIELLRKHRLVSEITTRCPSDVDYLEKPTLFHRDLHLNNIFVDDHTLKITSIIDWQGCSVLPLELQARIPRFAQAGKRPAPIDSDLEVTASLEEMEDEARKKVDEWVKRARRQNTYEALAAKECPELHAAITHTSKSKLPLLGPLQSVLGAWKNNTVYQVRYDLMDTVRLWDGLHHKMPACPITFSDDELDLLNQEVDNVQNLNAMRTEFEEAGMLPADGAVEPEMYEQMMDRNRQLKQMLIDRAEDTEQAKLSNEPGRGKIPLKVRFEVSPFTRCKQISPRNSPSNDFQIAMPDTKPKNKGHKGTHKKISEFRIDITGL